MSSNTIAASNISQESVFRAAIPYAIGTIAVGVIGIMVSVSAVSTSMQVVGIALAIFGTYAALATVLCGYDSADAVDFRAKWGKYTATTIFSGIVNLMAQIIAQVVHRLIFGESRRVSF